MKYFETGFITKRELYDALKQSSGLSSWNPSLDPTKIQAGVYVAPGCFVLQSDFNGTIDDVSSSSKGTIIYFFENTKRWGIISGEDKNKGVFQTILSLQTAYPTATNGDYALVIETGTFFAYYNNAWNNTGSNVAPDALRSTNNLNDLTNKTTARTNLDVYNKKETKDTAGALLVDTATIDFTYDNTLNAEKITADVKDNSISNVKIASNADISSSKIKQATITPSNIIFANNDTQDIINNKAQGQINNLTNLLNTRPVGASNGSVYYLTSQPSAIINYELLSFSPDNSPIDIESITINSTTIKANRLIGSYISSYDVGATVINGGNWLFNLYGYVSHLNSSRFEIDVYKRNLAGSETLLFTCETTDFLQISQVSPELNVVNVEKTQQDFVCDTTDKIVVKIYGKTGRSQDTTITLLHSGTDYASHIHTPLIVSHNNIAGLQGGSTNERFHLTQSQLTQIENLQNNLDLKENVVNKTTTFSATPANVKYPTEKLVKDNLDLKENVANKTTTFSAIPADIKYPTEKLVKDNLDLKVDKIAGKGLSTNDYTTAEQTKLAGIQAGATANSTDAYLLSRVNHTGSQSISTITNLSDTLNDKFSKVATSEINALVDKATLGDSDLILIEDTADAGKKKKATALNTYNYVNSKLASQFNAKVGTTGDETIGGNKTFSNNITLSSIPSLPNHLARIKDLSDITNTIGQPSGIASLGSDGKVPSAQLPAYVDDVVEYDNLASFPATGEAGKIYIAKDTNKTYRWSGSQYIEISSSLALGETSSTAYRGDLGKIAYDHSQSTGNPHSTTKTDIGLGNVDNTSDLNKPISTATQTALNLKAFTTNFRQESTRFVEKTYGSDLNNGLTLDKPFQTVPTAWNDVNPSGQVKIMGGAEYNVGTFTFNTLKESIKTILDNGAKLTGTINLIAGNTSMQFYNGKISATINDSSGGTCYFNGVDLSGANITFNNGGYKFIGNSTSSPASITLSGTGGTLVIQDITGGVVPLNIGAGWVVVYYNCTPAILSNAGTIIDGFNIPINSLISDQATLNVILAQTSSTSFGYYIVNFDNPVIAGMTIAKGDVFYKVSATVHIKVYSFNNAPASFSLIVSATQRNTIVKSVDKWAVPSSGTTVVDGAKINVIATDVASASTVNLDNATGEIVNITGNTTITAITLAVGIKRFVRFTGILTLTNGASLVLPSGANITTASGDTAILIGYASGVVRCVSYTRANGTALVGAIGNDTVASFSPVASANQILDVVVHQFSIFTCDGYATATLPATLSNAGKIMKITCSSASVGRLQIINSNRANYFLLANDTAIFECDGTDWRLISGPEYVIPVLGKLKQNYGRGIVFGYGKNLMTLGRGHESVADSAFGPYNDNYSPAPLTLFDADGVSLYSGTITKWKDIQVALEYGIALTEEGVVFQWGKNFAGINGAVRSPRRIIFPNNELIDSIYMSANTYNYNQASVVMAFYAISKTGKLYSWGAQNDLWQNLGHGDGVNRYTPTLITALQDKFIVKFAVSGNYAIFCGCIDITGQLYTWGWNGNPSANGNPLGNNVATPDTPVGVPTAVSGFTDCVDIYADGTYVEANLAQFRGHIRVIRSDGSTWASGYNGSGNLGITGTTSYRVFTRESTNKTNVAKISGGCPFANCNSIIITGNAGIDPNRVFFAGYNEYGIFNNGNSNDFVDNFTLNAIQQALPFQGKMYDLKGIICKAKIIGFPESGLTNCIILDGDGYIYISGYNNGGYCADGTRTNRITFNRVNLPKRVVDFVMIGWSENSDRGILVVFEDGTMMSWGFNNNGALGNSILVSNTSYPTPRYVIGFGENDKNK